MLFGEGDETEETKLGISKPNSEHSRDSTEFSNQNIYNYTMIVYISD